MGSKKSFFFFFFSEDILNHPLCVYTVNYLMKYCENDSVMTS